MSKNTESSCSKVLTILESCFLICGESHRSFIFSSRPRGVVSEKSEFGLDRKLQGHVDSTELVSRIYANEKTLHLHDDIICRHDSKTHLTTRFRGNAQC